MRAVVQRVSNARVSVDRSETGAIDAGLVAYVGVGRNDTERDALWIAEKIAELRVFEDDAGRMNRSVEQCGGGVLLISQFTLLGDARRGRRPSFAAAASGEPARDLYERVGSALETRGLRVAYGVFGADMEVQQSNQGPVTILLDSERTF
ncbi:MAG TPA: D-aminoacyl-tRNA deacylase [Candidatus Tumulicola sp.]